MNAFQPSNTANAACPSDSGWEASVNLPPTPDQDACNCAVSSATCSTAGQVSDEQIGQLLGTVCGQPGTHACSLLQRNGTTGNYGAYSFCNGAQQLAIAFNAYYQENKGQSNACNFKGAAHTQKPSAASTCSAVMASASSAATNGVQAGGSANGSGSSSGGSSGSGSGSSSAGGSASASSHGKGAAGTVRAPVISNKVQLGLYIVSAVGTGMLMLFL